MTLQQIFLILVVIYMLSFFLLIYLLERRQPACFEDLGEPNLISATSSRLPAVLDFIIARRHRKLSDVLVSACSDLALVAFVLLIVVALLINVPSAEEFWNRHFVL